MRHHKAELDALAPEGDEEERLGARRALLQNAERLGEAVAEAIAEIDGEGGAQQALARALRRLDRARDRAQGLLDAALAAAERAAAETSEALAALASAAQALELDPRALEAVEERLFALRALARKHSRHGRRSAAAARRAGDPARRDRDRRRRGRGAGRGGGGGARRLYRRVPARSRRPASAPRAGSMARSRPS